MSAFREAIEQCHTERQAWWIRNQACGLARDYGCSTAFINALRYCQSYADLDTTAREASGPGSEHVARWIQEKLRKAQIQETH